MVSVRNNLSSFPPFVLAGMHRSGTSMISALLERIGVDMGWSGQPPDKHNPYGYGEDDDFVDFHREIFRAAVPAGDGGWPDWGWTEHGQFDCRKLVKYKNRAHRLIEARKHLPGLWGWKDPRTTLFLDFWRDIAQDARFILVFRQPWEVADSIRRLEAGVFLRNPEYGYEIWSHYNQLMLEFYRRNSDQCILVSSNALRHEPAALQKLLERKWGMRTDPVDLSDLTDPSLFVSIPLEDPLVPLIAATLPSCMHLLASLNEAADLAMPQTAPAAPIMGFTRRNDPVTSTIVITCFDDGQFLPQSIASVERAAPHNCELIIVNDGSTQQRTVEILSTLEGLGYRVLNHSENRGLSAARNTGIGAAKGSFILPLDADNEVLPGYIERSIAALAEHPDAGVVYSDRELFGLRHRLVRVPEFSQQTLLKHNFIDACAVFRKQVWAECGGYDEALAALEDWDFWLAAASKGWQFYHLEGAFFRYQVRPGSMLDKLSRNPWNQIGILNLIFRKNQRRFVSNSSRLYLYRTVAIILLMVIYNIAKRTIYNLVALIGAESYIAKSFRILRRH